MLHIVTINSDYIKNAEIASRVPNDVTDTSMLRLMDQYSDLWVPYTPNPLIGTVDAANKYIAKTIVAQEQNIDPRMLTVHTVSTARQKLWLVDLIFDVTIIDPETETGTRENLTVSGIVMAENSECARDLAKYHYGTPSGKNKEYVLVHSKVTSLNSGPVDRGMNIQFILTQQNEPPAENP